MFYEHDSVIAWGELGICVAGVLLGLHEIVDSRDKTRVFRWRRKNDCRDAGEVPEGCRSGDPGVHPTHE